MHIVYIIMCIYIFIMFSKIHFVNIDIKILICVYNNTITQGFTLSIVSEQFCSFQCVHRR